MRRSQFADLVGVSKQQVGKYVADGAVVLDGSDVDVEASLAQLEGRLDEGKRQKALSLWGARSTTSAPSAGNASSSAKPLSGKARHDEAKAEMAELELAKLKGELLDAADVEARTDEAVQALRETMAAGRRSDADKICAKFGVPADKAAALARELADRDERAMGRFARAMGHLANGEGELFEANPVCLDERGIAA